MSECFLEFRAIDEGDVSDVFAVKTLPPVRWRNILIAAPVLISHSNQGVITIQVFVACLSCLQPSSTQAP